MPWLVVVVRLLVRKRCMLQRKVLLVHHVLCQLNLAHVHHLTADALLQIELLADHFLQLQEVV